MCVCLFALPPFVARSAATDAVARICTARGFLRGAFRLGARPPRWRRARARLPNAAPAAPRRDDGAEPNRRAPRPPRRDGRGARARVTAVWPRSAVSEGAAFLLGGRAARTRRRAEALGVYPPREETVGRVCGEVRVAGALAGGAPRSDESHQTFDRTIVVSFCQLLEEVALRRPAHSAPSERPSRTNFIHLPLAREAEAVRPIAAPAAPLVTRARDDVRLRFSASARTPRAARLPAPPRAQGARPRLAGSSRARAYLRRLPTDATCDATSSAHALKP